MFGAKETLGGNHVYISCELKDGGLNLGLYDPSRDKVWEKCIDAYDKPSVIDLSIEKYCKNIAEDFQKTENAVFSIDFNVVTGQFELLETKSKMRYGKWVMNLCTERGKMMKEWFAAAVRRHESLQQQVEAQQEQLKQMETIVERQKKLLDDAVDKRDLEMEQLYSKFLQLLNAKKTEIQKLRKPSSTTTSKQITEAYADIPAVTSQICTVDSLFGGKEEEDEEDEEDEVFSLL